ncbi:MAG TPA: hypothetical protein VEW46_12760 [Pyrinomonadaceae bacterium]|nr:hypothetical protein [Pyrinomonadaceae bacterium]
MNEANLKASSRTDWDRIDHRMTNDEIDTSDSPPLDDAFFAAAQWRLPEKKTINECTDRWTVLRTPKRRSHTT